MKRRLRLLERLRKGSARHQDAPGEPARVDFPGTGFRLLGDDAVGVGLQRSESRGATLQLLGKSRNEEG